MLKVIRRLLRRENLEEPTPGPQGEEYEALEVEREWLEQRRAFADATIRRKKLPFLDGLD